MTEKARGPSAEYPPILLTVDYATDHPPEPSHAVPGVALLGSQLRLETSVPHGNVGSAVGADPFRDVIVEARVSLREGADDDLYGLFLRQAGESMYYTVAMSPVGQCVVSRFDGQYHDIVNASLAPDMRFNRGLGRPNLFQIVACGPSLTVMVNAMVVTGILVDPRYKEGFLGFYLHHGASSARAELAADWIQVRGIFPDRSS